MAPRHGRAILYRRYGRSSGQLDEAARIGSGIFAIALISVRAEIDAKTEKMAPTSSAEMAGIVSAK